MFSLPQATELFRQLPKKAIYTKFNLNTAAKEKFDADISKLTLISEISPSTVNIKAGNEVSAIFVLLVSLKNKDYDEKLVSLLSKLIEQNMLFVLEYENEARLSVYRGSVLSTGWMPKDSLTISLKGLDLDAVWQNIIRSLNGGEWREELSLDENIANNQRIAKINKEIERLEKLARAEKQPKKKFELVQTIKELRNSLKENNQ